MVCAADTRGVLHSLTLALGTYSRGTKLTVADLTLLHRTSYLFGAVYRNMYMIEHTELEVEVQHDFYNQITRMLHSITHILQPNYAHRI
jgi:hypothetical protein